MGISNIIIILIINNIIVICNIILFAMFYLFHTKKDKNISTIFLPQWLMFSPGRKSC